MLVQAHCVGNTVTGLRVGRSNAKRYFARQAATVLLHLDHLEIECALPPEFWDGEAEIRDWRLCAWLQAKKHGGKLSHTVAVALTPWGENAFRVAPVAAKP